jgi:transcriptional regulator with XRE-family HTH domain
VSTHGAGHTLGEALLLSISKHGHTNHEAAAVMGTARANVHQWTRDLIDPWPENYDALTEYLGIELDTLGVLIIHSQMRRAEIRNQRAHPKQDANAIGS